MNQKNSDLQIATYSNFLSQLILISSGGIAACVTLLQVEKFDSRFGVLIAAGTFTGSLVFSAFGFTALLGQSTEKDPDIHNGLVRWPSFVAIGGTWIGLIFLIVSLGTSSLVLGKSKIPEACCSCAEGSSGTQ